MNAERLAPPARIETARLVLRAWRPEDARFLQVALVESVNHLSPWIPWATATPPTLAETQARLGVWIADFASGANFVYAVYDRMETQMIGGVGLYPRVGPGALEIGYWIRLTRVGAGFGTEATLALTHAGFDLPDVERIEIHCAQSNVASRRIPEKLGYRLAGIRRQEGPHGASMNLAVYEMSRKTYIAAT